jgi:hypothetical protein
VALRAEVEIMSNRPDFHVDSCEWQSNRNDRGQAPGTGAMSLTLWGEVYDQLMPACFS